MGFDLATAKSNDEPTKTGFDLSTAQPENSGPLKMPVHDYSGLPGEKTEAALRGFSQGATLGYGDEIQAGIRSLIPGNPSYAELRDQQRAANKKSQAAQPLIYGGADVAASLPSALATGGESLLGRIGLGAATSAATGLGSAEGTPEEQAKTTALSGLAGAALPIIGSAVKYGGKVIKDISNGVNPLAGAGNAIMSRIPGTELNTATKAAQSEATALEAQKQVSAQARQAAKESNIQKAISGETQPTFPNFRQNLSKADQGIINRSELTAEQQADPNIVSTYLKATKDKDWQPFVDLMQAGKKSAGAERNRVATGFNENLGEHAANAAAGALGAYATGQNPIYGAAAGATLGSKVNLGKNVGNAVGKVANIAGSAITNPVTRATTQALINMSGSQAKQVKQKYEPRIQEAVDRGQPKYAATFQALSSNPDLRAAQAADTDNSDNESMYNDYYDKEEANQVYR